MGVPSWLRCENCLWFAFAGEIQFYHAVTLEKEDITGCIHPDISPQIHSCFYRCPRYVCKRCLMSLENIILNSPDVDNHNHCARVGRGKKTVKNSGFITNGDDDE